MNLALARHFITNKYYVIFFTAISTTYALNTLPGSRIRFDKTHRALRNRYFLTCFFHMNCEPCIQILPATVPQKEQCQSETLDRNITQFVCNSNLHG